MESSNKHLFTVKTTWFSYVLTAVVVAARAFQPNAQPMCDWSWWSWLLMTLPVTMPIALMAAWLVLYIIASGAIALLEGISKIRR